MKTHKLIARIVMSYFKKQEGGTPLDLTPGLKVSKVVIPSNRGSFNDTFDGVRKELLRA
jgi:hypothetical protein